RTVRSVTARASNRSTRTIRMRRRVAFGCPVYVQTVNATNSTAMTASAGNPMGESDHGYAGRLEKKKLVSVMVAPGERAGLPPSVHFGSRLFFTSPLAGEVGSRSDPGGG